MKRTLAPVATILVAMVSIQSGAALAKQLFPIVGPAGASTLRLFFAAAILLLVWRPSAKDWAGHGRNLLLYGTSLGAMNLLFYLSLERIPLGLAVAFEFCGPLSLALMRSRRALDFLWVACAVTGLVLLLPMATPDRLDPIGIALALAAGACWAFYIVFGQLTGSAMHGGVAVALGMCVAALLVLPVGVVVSGPNMLSWRVAGAALAVAILSSALPYSLEMYALKRMRTHTFGVLMSIEPAIGAVSGFTFLREALGVLQWTGIGLIMVASFGCTLIGRNIGLGHE